MYQELPSQSAENALRENPIESTAELNDSVMSKLIPEFQKYAQYDLNFSPETVWKYGETLKTVIRHIGDLPVEQIEIRTITDLKQKIIQGGAGEAREWFYRTVC